MNFFGGFASVFSTSAFAIAIFNRHHSAVI
jgi:hypothetical protein